MLDEEEVIVADEVAEEVVIKTPDHKKISFIKDNQTTRDLRDGALNITKNPLDFGLSGQGYFMIQTPQGIRYTRNGQFTRDSNGRLVTASGHPVLNAGGGEIILPTSIKDFTVSDSGDITLNKTSAGRIGIVSFENEHSMHLEGDSMLSTTQEAILTPLKAFKVTQGAYEESNISSVNESIKLMETMRRFEEAQKLINQYEELKKKMMNASPRNV